MKKSTKVSRKISVMESFETMLLTGPGRIIKVWDMSRVLKPRLVSRIVSPDPSPFI